MESNNYDFRNRNFIGTLTGLTYDVLQPAKAPERSEPVRAAESAPGRSWLDRLDDWLWNQELKSREAFLAKSTDIVDLEQRMRWLEHGDSLTG